MLLNLQMGLLERRDGTHEWPLSCTMPKIDLEVNSRKGIYTELAPRGDSVSFLGKYVLTRQDLTSHESFISFFLFR